MLIFAIIIYPPTTTCKPKARNVQQQTTSKQINEINKMILQHRSVDMKASAYGCNLSNCSGDMVPKVLYM